MILPFLPSLIVAGFTAVAGFGLAWQLQADNITQLKLEQTNERLAQQRAVHQVKERQLDAVVKAQNNAATRTAVLRRESNDSRTAAQRLLDQSADSLRAASTSLEACTATAATLSVISNQCTTRYSELGEKAQGHVSDIQTMIEAWPQ